MNDILQQKSRNKRSPVKSNYDDIYNCQCVSVERTNNLIKFLITNVWELNFRIILKNMKNACPGHRN